MLKIVSTKQVRLGMFIHELKGPWIDHPFWKRTFKLEDPADLKKLQTSIVKEVVIDTSKGLDVARVEDNAKDMESVVTLPADDGMQVPKVKRVTSVEERSKAKQVISASKQAVTSMFNDARMGKAIKAEVAM